MNKKILFMIGMAKRAGKVSTGEFICVKAIRSGSAKLVITANDASDNTKKSISNSCEYYKTPNIFLASKSELGKYTGADIRSVVSINDNNFARAILDIYNQSFSEKEKG